MGDPSRELLKLSVVAGAAWLGVAVPPVHAQEQAPTPPAKSPRTDPGLSDPSLDDEIAGRRQRHEPSAPIAPTPPKPAQKAVPSVSAPVVDAPGITGTEFGLPQRKFYPEGSFLPPHQGNLVRARTGDLIFVPESSPGGLGEPPMVLLGCQRLAQIDAASLSPGFAGLVTLSGQVFVYRDRHYLLPTVYAVPAPAPRDADTPEPKGPDKKSTEPKVEDLIRDLESQRGPTRAMDPGMTRPPVEAAPAPKGAKGVVTEGTVIIMRRGRLVRQAAEDGRYAFVFDNAPNSPAPPPMTLLPCAELLRLETLASTRGDDLVFRISGRVTVYQGRNFLLATMHQVMPPGEIVPMQ